MNRDFKGIWIPREIWLNQSLSIQAKALWAEIHSLHDRESGGCYASNDYLCEFMNVKLSRLKEIMKELRDAKLITDVAFDGRHRIIRAEMPEVEYGGQQPAGKPAGREPENRPSTSRKTGHPSYIENKEYKKEEREGAFAPKPPAPSDPLSNKKERAPFVLLSDIDHQKLIDKLGPEVTAACYKILSEWKEDSPKSKWKKCDYRSILRWVIDRYKEDKAKAAKAPAAIDTPEENRDHAVKLAENFNPVRAKQAGWVIEPLSKHVELVPQRSNAQPICIAYTEKGFREQLENAMRKCGLY